MNTGSTMTGVSVRHCACPAMPSRFERDVQTFVGVLPGQGPEWQAVQVIFSMWTAGRPGCLGFGAPRRPPMASAPSAPSTPRWQPRQDNSPTAGFFLWAASPV